MTRDVVDAEGRWILTNELCEGCGSPSWDDYPNGVVANRWTCQRCGHQHMPSIDVLGLRTGPIPLDEVGS